jgi:hypothetical protein
MADKLLLTTYLAAAIEHSKKVLEGKTEDWKAELKKGLTHPLVGIYDPVDREAQKTGKKSGEHVGYVCGLKQGGHWDKFLWEMKKIWWGRINPKGHKVDIMKQLRNRFLVDGNEMRDLDFWGDIEAVLRSDFIMVYMEKEVKTIGTVREITYAEMFDIPIFLILPDQTKTEANSTLLEMVMNSGGDIFYNAKDAVKAIREKYSINWENK